jgi:flagellar basal-body rod protein FlgF
MPMENSLLVGLSRQVSLGRELEAVANNIANLNTTGFKADGTLFEEYMMPLARENAFAGSDRRVSFVRDRATWHDLSPGPLMQTGNPLDVAVGGNNFLVVQTPAGERYTRNGAFQIGPTGELVTSDGDKVLGDGGPIQFQSTDNKVHIAEDGTVSVREGANSNVDTPRGKLRVVSFANPSALHIDCSSRFMKTPNHQPQAATQVHVTQGALEKSNVKAVVEMTRMIEITRTYTQVAGILQQQSDLRRSSIEKLAEVPT